MGFGIFQFFEKGESGSLRPSSWLYLCIQPLVREYSPVFHPLPEMSNPVPQLLDFLYMYKKYFVCSGNGRSFVCILKRDVLEHFLEEIHSSGSPSALLAT